MELDRTLLPILAETLSDYDNVEIVPGDILKTDIAALCRERMPGLPVVACANLPYNITTPVITALLQAQCFQAVTVMIQREVAQRICAQPGTPEYGAFTLLCQYYADCALLYDVNPGKAPGGGGGPGPLFSGGPGGICPEAEDPCQLFVSSFGKKCGKADPEWSAPCLQFDGDHSWGAPYFCGLCPINGKTKRNQGKLKDVTCIKSCKEI